MKPQRQSGQLNRPCQRTRRQQPRSQQPHDSSYSSQGPIGHTDSNNSNATGVHSSGSGKVAVLAEEDTHHRPLSLRVVTPTIDRRAWVALANRGGRRVRVRRQRIQQARLEEQQREQRQWAQQARLEEQQRDERLRRREQRTRERREEQQRVEGAIRDVEARLTYARWGREPDGTASEQPMVVLERCGGSTKPLAWAMSSQQPQQSIAQRPQQQPQHQSLQPQRQSGQLNRPCQRTRRQQPRSQQPHDSQDSSYSSQGPSGHTDSNNSNATGVHSSGSGKVAVLAEEDTHARLEVQQQEQRQRAQQARLEEQQRDERLRRGEQRQRERREEQQRVEGAIRDVEARLTYS
ncbi:putative uncharacterized protein DDB_G0271606 [Scaptodrosophila lebanonensis]|uniref:Uncharacterized protein n=1 Tax=Drosophila lebanonensis TaxID=7225 RepID=A0A6J2UEI8_DROLE|nr:putative uncharacterized protein DDB_G0271606 [Scaptodrosophila lebanonensis]